MTLEWIYHSVDTDSGRKQGCGLTGARTLVVRSQVHSYVRSDVAYDEVSPNTVARYQSSKP